MITTLWIFAYLAVGLAGAKALFLTTNDKFADQDELDQVFTMIGILVWPFTLAVFAVGGLLLGMFLGLKRIL